MIRTDLIECSLHEIDWNGENDENISIDLCRVIYPVGVVWTAGTLLDSIDQSKRVREKNPIAFSLAH